MEIFSSKFHKLTDKDRKLSYLKYIWSFANRAQIHNEKKKLRYYLLFLIGRKLLELKEKKPKLTKEIESFLIELVAYIHDKKSCPKYAISAKIESDYGYVKKQILTIYNECVQSFNNNEFNEDFEEYCSEASRIMEVIFLFERSKSQSDKYITISELISEESVCNG